MTPNFRIDIGDCVASLQAMKARGERVQTCVTSPPYFNLRDYGVEGQIGLEETPEEFVANLVQVFRSVRDVLADDGTLWLNIGDSYNAYNGNRGAGNSFDRKRDVAGGVRPKLPKGAGLTVKSLKNKDLIGIPWRLAFALQADGWYLRQDIIWSKPNPMPESVRDRCTKAHEYVFLLSKSARYYFNAKAIREPVRSTVGNSRSFRGGGNYTDGKSFNNHGGATRSSRGNATSEDGKRNMRSVWSVATRPFDGAHFATFPPDLVKPCVLAGSRVGDTVLDPFGGSGTTAGVALAFGRDAVLCELNADYATLVPDRVQSILAEYGKAPKKSRAMREAQQSLFPLITTAEAA